MLKLKFFICFLVFIFINVNSYADHPIFILLTHPRATGTAFEKVIRTQANMIVLHQPFLDPHIIRKYGPDHPFTQSLPNPSITFQDVADQLFISAKQSPVFFKESAYLLINYLKEHPEFYKNPQVKIAFLVRDPAKSIISFYKKMPSVDDSVVGHRQVWELFSLLKDYQKQAPLVIDSDELLKDPIYILNRVGEHWGLEFNESNLKWESGYSSDWHLKDWYVEVADSTELGQYRGDVARQKDGTPKYLEVTDEKDRLRLQELYRVQNGYYQNLLQYALKARN